MSENMEMITMIGDAARRIFTDHCDPQTINSASDDAWKKPLWAELESNGLTTAWVPEAQGGAGAGLGAGFAVLDASGAFAVPVPLAETLLAGWLLSQAGLDVPAGAMTVAPVRTQDQLTIDDKGRISGIVEAVPFAPESGKIAVAATGESGVAVALVRTKDVELSTSQSIADDAMAAVIFKETPSISRGELADGLDASTLMLMGAAVRSVQIAGALKAILDMSVTYASDREAFGRPIAKFQAIQHCLARLAGEVAAATAVAGSAADTLEQDGIHDPAAFLEVASAKVRTGEAAGEGAAIAHQVFGAIGYTQEHVLHRYTRRLWAWRDDFGSESQWAVRLGQKIAADGADKLWPMLAAR